jgi:hypothetical protein
LAARQGDVSARYNLQELSDHLTGKETAPRETSLEESSKESAEVSEADSDHTAEIETNNTQKAEKQQDEQTSYNEDIYKILNEIEYFGDSSAEEVIDVASIEYFYGNYSPPNLFCQPKPSEWQSKG